MPTTTGMVGRGYYDAHSDFQAKVAESGAALLSEAVAAARLPDPNAAVVVADYGCAEGRNSISTVGRALDAFAARGATDFCVLHNDLPSNDFAMLIQNLSRTQSYLNLRPQTRVLLSPRSFFERVTLPKSVTLSTPDSAAHWLSRQPAGIDMPTSLYRSDAPPSEREKILAQAAADWLTFLSARSEELQPGGVLFVQMLGADDRVDPARVSAAGLLKLMNECALEMVEAGEIPREVYARYCFPVVPRTVEEALAPVQGPLAGTFEVLHAGLTPVPSPYQEALARTGDVAAFAKSYTALTRAFSETSLTQGLFAPAGGDVQARADRFYAGMEQRLLARPGDYPFDDLTLTVALRRQG